MSSSSRPRSRFLVGGALVAVTGALAWVSTAGAASTLDVVAVIPAKNTVSVVVAVNPPPSLTQPGAFRVASGDDGKLATDARPVIGPQLATGVVVDTSAAGAGALQGGVNGAANLLLQLPDGVRNLVVADGGDRPELLSPLSPGAIAAVGALNSARAGGDRHPAAALSTALAGLSAASGQPRLLLLYTGAADAGGEPAAALGRRLADAGVVLAVIATGADQQYWSQASAATGGVLVSARDGGTLRPFDQLASLLRERFVLTFPRPGMLPATVRVSVTVGTATTSQTALVPADAAAPTPAPGTAQPSGSGSSRPWWVLGVLVLLAAVAGAVFLARRRSRRPEPGPEPLPAVALPPIGPGDPAGPLPPAGPRAGDAGSGELPRRKPGASPLRGHVPPPAAPAEPPGVDPEQTVEIARPRLRDGPPPAAAPAKRQHPAAAAPGKRQHPAADERAYSRLDEETAKAAAAVAAGTMEFRHAVARIAMAAPGRVDLLDRVIETEHRLSGVQIGNSPPSKTVLDLLTAARRVVAGEVALVGPTGVRVEQASSVLRLIRPDRTTRECRSAKELARHVDLSTLSVDAPAS